ESALVEGDFEATWRHRQEVVARLDQYRAFYDAEISRQLERLTDISKALASVSQSEVSNGSRVRALEVLNMSLKDAKNCLQDAQLAKTRIELEIGVWSAANNGDQVSAD
ncbi:hypothetical protein GGI04_004815, partial [Coemansia thaxteri]